MSNYRCIVVAAAIVDCLQNPRKLLCAARAYPPALRGKWEFPGGKLEDGESPTDALTREIWEELGAKIEIGPVVTSHKNDADQLIYPLGADLQDLTQALPLNEAADTARHFPKIDWPINNKLVMRVWLAQLLPDQGSPSTTDPAHRQTVIEQYLPHLPTQPNSPHLELRWVDFADLCDLDWLPPDQPIIAALLATRGSQPNK